MIGHLLELLFFIFSDVLSLTLGKPVNKKCPFPRTLQNNGAVPLGLPMTWPSNALFDHPSAQIGINLAALGSPNSISEGVIGDPLITCKTAKPSVLENPHGTRLIVLHKVLPFKSIFPSSVVRPSIPFCLIQPSSFLRPFPS